jgi:hypothetical protein
MRWRIKFVVVALAVIFGARLYVRSQAILFSAPDIALWSVESGALLIGCLFLTLAYVRTGLAGIDLYPSTTVLRSSLTMLIVGGYLFIVGVLAQVVSRFGGAEIFQFQAVIVLLGMAGLAVLLLSDRARQRIHVFVGRHFGKAQHDSARVWTLLSLRLASVTDQPRLSTVSAKLISETFDVLSVTAWLRDEEKGGLVIGASTARQKSEASGASSDTASSAVTPDYRQDRHRLIWKTSTRHGRRNYGNSIRRPLQRAATVCVFPCAPENKTLALSCWQIESMGRSIPSRNWSC